MSPVYTELLHRLKEVATLTSAAALLGWDQETMMPAKVNWKSHNYTHLMEQPTIFYAAVLILALAGEGSGINLALAWAYVAIRVVHSIWQATVNIISVRITLFTVSTLCLWVLAINAVRSTVF